MALCGEAWEYSVHGFARCLVEACQGVAALQELVAVRPEDVVGADAIICIYADCWAILSTAKMPE